MEYPVKISNKIVKPRTKTYEEWWLSPVETVSGHIYKNKQTVTHGMYVKEFYYNILDILRSTNHKIEDENKLKREIVTIIYTLSTDNI
tara:strand:+ start:962 stop:1225 length:264 start_codon:yes stop_codon:yes gene_type:complete